MGSIKIYLVENFPFAVFRQLKHSLTQMNIRLKHGCKGLSVSQNPTFAQMWTKTIRLSEYYI